MSTEVARFLLLRTYQVLLNRSDEEHPLTQADIIKYLNLDFNVVCDRRTVSQNIQCLMDLGYDIINSHKGSYLITRPLENSELRLLIDSVLSNQHISKTHSKQLVNKLLELGSPSLKNNTKYVYAVKDINKTASTEIFYNIDIISEAIGSRKKISFDYYKYKEDGELHKSSSHVVSPYQMILHNQHYYLILRDENRKSIAFYKMDKISSIKILDEDITPIESNPEFKNGIHFEKYSNNFPYLFNDEIIHVRLKCDTTMADTIVDWFGKNTEMIKDNKDQNKMIVALDTSQEAILYWALQYNNKIEILTPIALRQKMVDLLESTINQYK